MSELVIIDDEFNERRNEVAELMMTGLSEFATARRLGIKVVEVRRYWNQWKDIVREDADTRDVARDHLDRMVKHYDMLIEKSHQNLKDLETLVYDEKISAQVNATLKNIADYEAKRVDALQKAGLLDNTELGDELAKREEREATIISMLNDLCPACKVIIGERMKALTGQVQPVQEYDD